MSSLPFSLGTHSPTCHKPSINGLHALNSHVGKSSSIKIPNPQYKSHSQFVQVNELNRREALGIGFSFGILQFLWHPHSATADESSACEFTVTPSRLAYCDKVVGSGPEAVKGQLIKAHYLGGRRMGRFSIAAIIVESPFHFVLVLARGWDRGILGGDGVPVMLASI